MRARAQKSLARENDNPTPQRNKAGCITSRAETLSSAIKSSYRIFIFSARFQIFFNYNATLSPPQYFREYYFTP